tara:strand:+ start:7059 stop:9668 length:2610 start_codon:yes stop_codon:yes gene_type:complete
MNNFNIKTKKVFFLFAIIIGLITLLTVFANDVIETVVTGKVKPAVVTPYIKKFTVGQTIYGFNRNEDSNGAFVNFTVITSTDNEVTWSEPTEVLSAADLAGKGSNSNDDYSSSILRAIKWFQCPATGNMTIWAKRHGIDSNGNLIVKKELLRATILGEDKTPADSYTDSIIIDQPFGYSSGDLGNINDNGSAYIISSATNEGLQNILELNNDCSDIAGTAPLASLSWHLDDGSEDHREAPSIFKQDNTFYLTTSGKTSWRPNQQKYAYAQYLAGPWSEMINLGDSTAYHSQLFSTAKVTATDGSGAAARIFSATRNAATWNASDSRPVWMPLYFNSTTALETNYYDYIEINHTQGRVKGFQYDHGTQLDIADVVVDGFSDDASALIDGDLATSWFNNNDASKISVTFDLGTAQTVKAIKLKQYDKYLETRDDVTLRTPRLKVEIGDGTQFTNVFEDITGSITWLQPIDVIDTLGRYVRLSLVENHKGNSAGITNDFGFYETEIWGNNANATPLINSDFNADVIGNAPSDWTVTEGTDTTTIVVDDNNNQVVQLQDNSNSDRTTISQVFTAQKGSEVITSFDVKFTTLGKGEYLRLLSNGIMLVNIVNSTAHNTLSFSDANFNDTPIANILASTWYSLKLIANTDTETFDIYLDQILVWGGAKFANSGNFIDEIIIGTSTNKTASTMYFDNITLTGPINNAVELTDLFNDDFETTNNNWTVASGSWTTTTDTTQVYSNTSSTNDVVTAGDNSWSDYSITADVKRNGQGAAILGRYSASNTYYQLMIYNTNSYKLSKNVNGSWTELATGSFVNNNSTYYQLKLDFNGTAITAAIDGQSLTTVTDTSITVGSIGLRVVNGTANYDNVVVTAN